MKLLLIIVSLAAVVVSVPVRDAQLRRVQIVDNDEQQQQQQQQYEQRSQEEQNERNLINDAQRRRIAEDLGHRAVDEEGRVPAAQLEQVRVQDNGPIVRSGRLILPNEVRQPVQVEQEQAAQEQQQRDEETTESTTEDQSTDSPTTPEVAEETTQETPNSSDAERRNDKKLVGVIQTQSKTVTRFRTLKNIGGKQMAVAGKITSLRSSFVNVFKRLGSNYDRSVAAQANEGVQLERKRSNSIEIIGIQLEKTDAVVARRQLNAERQNQQ